MKGTWWVSLFVVFGVGLAAAPGASAQAAGGRLAFNAPLGEGPVYVVSLRGTIDKEQARYVERAVARAEEEGAALVLLHLDTFGGLVDAAERIRTVLLDAPVPTVAFVDRNAASAGALISYAADRIVMAPGASIGAATVVKGLGGEVAPEKYQSYMRGLMRATAEANGRDPRLAEAMVDPAVQVEGLSRPGQVLTLSAEEAVRHGVADAVLPDAAAVREALGVGPAAVVAYGATWSERVLRFFGSPLVQGVLLLLLLGGLYVELHSPGVGIPGLVSLVAAVLFFAPNYLLGLVESWEVVLFGIGLVLLLVELFVLPGFGVAGITGVVLVVGSLLAALIGNVGFAFPPLSSVAPAIVTMAVTLVLLVALLFSLGRYLPHASRVGQLVLSPDPALPVGDDPGAAVEHLVGRTGVALTPLRPSGRAEIEGARVDVITAGEYVVAGAAVRVVRVRGSRVEVRPAPALQPEGETSPA